MLEEDNQTGASRENPNDRLEGEILMSLADWRLTHQLESLDLGYRVVAALMSHIHKTDGVEARVQFSQFLATLSNETLDQIVETLRLDAKATNRLH